MPSFKIEIVETLSRIVEVEAESLDDAELKVSHMWKDGEVTLYAEDFVDVEFLPFEED